MGRIQGQDKIIRVCFLSDLINTFLVVNKVGLINQTPTEEINNFKGGFDKSNPYRRN